MIFFEAKIAIGEDSGEAGTARNGQAGDTVLGHNFKGLAKSDVGRDGDGVDDHAGFGALYSVHFLALPVDGHVAMNDADAALACNGDGEAGFGHRIHGRGGERNGELEFPRKVCARGDFVGQDGRFTRDEKNVVECKAFLNWTVDHSNPFEKISAINTAQPGRWPPGREYNSSNRKK